MEEQVKLLSPDVMFLVFLFPFFFLPLVHLVTVCQLVPLAGVSDPPPPIVRHSFHGQVAEGETVYRPHNPQEV